MNIRTVIYGAGAAGQAARGCAMRDTNRSVVAFADRDPRKIDTRIADLPVVGPAALTGDWFDEVVVASHAWRDITTSLLAAGIPADRLSVYHAGEDRLAPFIQSRGGPSAPCVLVLTDDCVSPGHGIGAVLLKHLAHYPAHRLAHVYLRKKGDPFWPASYQLAPAASREDSESASAGARASGGGAPRALEEKMASAADIAKRLTASGHAPDVIYANVFGEAGLEALEALVDALGGSVPVIQHFHDWLYADADAFARVLRRVSPRVAEFWAITDALGRHISQLIGRPVETVNTFKCEIAPVHKRDHRDLDDRFKVVMLGNSHMPWVLHHVRNVWRTVQQAVPGIGPIQWFAYPTSVLYVREAGVEFSPEIEYYGYLNDRVLHEHLCAADLAIVPFNIADEPEYHYAAHSVPSRITEFLNAGLPILAAAGAQTETRRFITDRGLGVCGTIAREQEFAGTLLALMNDTARRLALSRQGRAFAESHCDVRKHRDMLRSAFSRVSGWRQARPAA
jgi:hypothetical protein